MSVSLKTDSRILFLNHPDTKLSFLIFWPKLGVCFSFGKGINSGLSPGSQDFTISGCPLACVCSPLAFIFHQLTGSSAEGKANLSDRHGVFSVRAPWRSKCDCSHWKFWFPEFASFVWTTRRVVQWLCSWLEATGATPIQSWRQLSVAKRVKTDCLPALCWFD